MLADVMNITPTVFTDVDKIELAKRVLMEERARESPPSPPQSLEAQTSRTRAQPSIPNVSVPSSGVRTRVSAQLELMAQKVKEVLPQVPLDVILKDIKVTTNVDETISRLLEGSVPYVPEAPPKPTPTPDSKSASNTSSNNSFVSTESSKLFYCGSSTFGKNATERTKSYQERKEALIQTARRRYLERKGLTDKEAVAH